MQVICCYANLDPRTRTALTKHSPEADLVNVAGDPFAYWREISERWSGNVDLVTIEQDMGITKEVVPSFRDCPEPWCSFWYRGPAWGLLPGEYESQVTINDMARLRFSLGCTKFSAKAQRAVTYPHEPVSWDFLDVRIAEALIEAGYSPHIHGEVEHFHEYPLPDWMKAARSGHFTIEKEEATNG